MGGFLMTRSVHVSTRTTFEVEVDLSGSYAPGYAATRDDPGHDGEVEEVEVDTVWAIRPASDNDNPPGVPKERGYLFWDLTKGLDKAARAQLAANVLEYLGSEADQLIVDEAHNV